MFLDTHPCFWTPINFDISKDHVSGHPSTSISHMFLDTHQLRYFQQHVSGHPSTSIFPTHVSGHPSTSIFPTHVSGHPSMFLDTHQLRYFGQDMFLVTHISGHPSISRAHFWKTIKSSHWQLEFEVTITFWFRYPLAGSN
jgi:hypothetical protein